MKYDAKRYAQALVESCQGKTESEMTVLVNAWLDLIIKQGQKSLLPLITKEVEMLYRADEVDVLIESAKPLDTETRNWLTQYLSTIITGKKLVFQEQANPELLTGYLIKYQDKELNLSLKGILNDLRDQIAA